MELPMGRPERLLFPELNPLHAFALSLRELRKRAGNPKYSAMARGTGRSSTALSEAAGGDKLPTWDTVIAYVSFCNEDPDSYLMAWERVRDHRRSRQDDTSQPDPVSKPEAPPMLSNLPRHPARVFLGRDDALVRVDELLGSAGHGIVIGPVLHGLGGIGKTELAIQYAHRHRRRFNPIWWISADTQENVSAGLAALTRNIEPRWPVSASVVDTAAWAQRWLAAHTGWLLILDNVVDPKVIEPILAMPASGLVIATSRRYLDWQALGLAPMLIPQLSVDTSVDLLARRSGRHEESTELHALAEEFSGLPLALNHAAAYLVERPYVSLAQYRAWLSEQPSHVLGTRALAHPSDALVARTWQVSVDAVDAVDPLATKILNVMAYLGPDRIPVGLFSPLARPLAVEDATALLTSYSLVSRSERHTSVHRLVQTVIRSAHADASALATAIDLLYHALPVDDPETAVADWPRWAELAPHVAAIAERLGDERPSPLTVECINTAGEVLLRTAFYHRGQGRYAASVALYERSMHVRGEALGADHADTLASRYGLAGGYWSTGRFEQALELATATLAARRATLGDDHPDTLQNASNVAVGLREIGLLYEATELTRSTLAASEKVLGPDHPDTLRARNNLAGCYRAAGRHEESIALHAETLLARRRALGEMHPDTLQSRHNLAGGHEALGRLDEAVAGLEYTLASRLQLLGSTHPDTCHTRFILARVCQAAGRHAQAVMLLEETVAARRWLLGPDHPDTRAAEVSLAETRLTAQPDARI
ncbi:FxSxx-COOH system tetratricopeptide repeat protein [Micromonospora sp. CA-263727]|uniref:FxSxx-COOH system tetratricopeptide repeat protein n=1 Tax=Micromonospora sp. CA-263727 TaxID=3239967 RepID=UPI003D90A526